MNFDLFGYRLFEVSEYFFGPIIPGKIGQLGHYQAGFNILDVFLVTELIFYLSYCTKNVEGSFNEMNGCIL